MKKPPSHLKIPFEVRDRMRDRVRELMQSWTTLHSPARVMAAAYRSALEVVAKEHGYSSLEGVRRIVGRVTWHSKRL